MADSSEASIPDEFFLRERIDFDDIRRVVPNGADQTDSSVLKNFSLICQRTKQSQASWKAFDLVPGWNGDGNFQETELALKNMTDSGLFVSLQELALRGAVFELWSKSRIPSPLRRLTLKSVEGEEQQTAIGKYLRSNDANLLESLSVSGSYEALATIIESLGSGQVSTLRQLSFGCSDSLATLATESLAKILFQSLSEGAVNELRVLELWGFGFGGRTLSALANSSQLKNLETLRLSGMEIFEDDSKSFVSSIPADHWQNLQVLDIRPTYLGVSALDSIIRLLESGKASSVANIIMGSFDYINMGRLDYNSKTCNIYIYLIRIAKALEMQKLPSLQNFPLFGRADSPCNMDHEISQEVQTAFLSAYQNNKLLTTCLVDEYASQNRFMKTLRQYEQRNKQNVERMKVLGNESIPATYGKLFLCGSPRIGKTTLRRTLTRKNNVIFSALNQCVKPKEELATRGIEVEHMRFVAKGSHQQELELAVWDLAGHFEYEVLHSAFLPDLALADGQATFFLIVCSANADGNSSFQTAQDTLLYWLKFIASSSSKVDLRARRVSVVLNCFYDQQHGHEKNRWMKYLMQCRTAFKDFLNLHPEPFIVNAKIQKQVRLLKEHIQCEAQESLLGIEVPKICADMLETCHIWAANNQAYPVVSWEEYLMFFKGFGWSIEKLQAATTYLHEAGLFIFFKKLRELKQSSSQDQFSLQAALVLDPEWLCKRVIGDLLLPEFLLNPGETSLVLSHIQENGSLELALVAREQFEIPQQNCEELVRILERLGLGYTLPHNNQDIFIPALIKDDNLPQWFVEPSQSWAGEEVSSWIMGFSLASQDFKTTLLPIAILRNLQVSLALDEDKGQQPDSHFKAGISRISFKWQQVGILVEYYRNSDNAHHNRLDILVKPLVPNMSTSSNDARLRRQHQIKLAQEIMHQTLRIASNCCPGLELGVAIVRPWACAGPFVPLNKRDVSFSVKQMVARMQREIDSTIKDEKGEIALATTWDVDGVLVEYQDVLGEEDFKNVMIAFEKKCMYTESALKSVGLMPRQAFCGVERDFQIQLDGNCGEEGSKDELIQRLVHDISTLRFEMHQRFDNIESHIQGLTQELQKVIKFQVALNRYVRSLVTFTVEEKLTTVPRFLYLTENQKEKSAWVRIKDAFSQEVFLHFLCEAGHGDSPMHEVACQLGVSIRYTKEWAKKLAPILDWTLRIAIVAARVASSVVLPGLDLITNFTSKAIVDAGLIAGGTGALLSDVSKLYFDSIQNNPEFSLENNARQQGARREALLFVKKEIVEKLSVRDFEQQIGLTRVRISDTNGHTQRVAWICKACHEKYGILAEEVI